MERERESRCTNSPRDIGQRTPGTEPEKWGTNHRGHKKEINLVCLSKLGPPTVTHGRSEEYLECTVRILHTLTGTRDPPLNSAQRAVHLSVYLATGKDGDLSLFF